MSLNYKEMAAALVDTDLREEINSGPSDGELSPEQPRQQTLRDFLTDQQIAQVERIWVKNVKAGTPDNAVAEFKAYLRPFGAELEAKGVLPDYLAYLLYARYSGII